MVFSAPYLKAKNIHVEMQKSKKRTACIHTVPFIHGITTDIILYEIGKVRRKKIRVSSAINYESLQQRRIQQNSGSFEGVLPFACLLASSLFIHT
jgi:hypothetical protein